MKQDLDRDKIVASVVRCVLQMEYAYLDLLVELYSIGWISAATLEAKLEEHQVYRENRLVELKTKGGEATEFN
jgi:hypothetical protein